jgi:hypothetical protein
VSRALYDDDDVKLNKLQDKKIKKCSPNAQKRMIKKTSIIIKK